MSQYFYEFTVNGERIYYPVQMLVRTRRSAEQITFEFSEAVFSVQASEEKLNTICVQLLHSGAVTAPMEARMVERQNLNDA